MNPYLQYTASESKRKTRILHQEPFKVGKSIPFPFGNYHNYYSNRTKGYKTDPRVKLFRKEWFEHKSVLDVGCNSGHISLAISKIFQPFSVEGVDIDPELIARANYNLAMTKSVVLLNESQIIWDYFPLSAPVQLGLKPCECPNVTFRCSDWVHESIDTRYDVILALSITKWIQLNNGDGAVRHFFNKVFDALNPSGVFILEPQPFQGYHKKATSTQRMLENFQSIKFFPDKFKDYLLKIGFKLLVEELVESESKGFERPFFVFIKA